SDDNIDNKSFFIKKLTKKGVKIVDSPMAGRNVTTIVFCPIVSRFETDINSHIKILHHVLSRVIVVAMHHTFDKEYTLPNNRQMNNRAVILLVDCLFHETKGFLSCTRNKNSVKMVRKEVITSFLYHIILIHET
uniref:Uncharacterized protein n=1 Tax=Dicentrarchus labrax TaxID=13489 RepID=A0A8C4EK50_DICLA